MAKQIYIDENGNEHLVSGTINTANMLPYDSNTSTKAKIDTKADASSTYNKSEVDTLINGKASKSLIDYYQSKAGNPAVVNGIGGYASILILGFAQGIGAVAILIKINNATIASTIDLYTGQPFTSASLTFSYSSASFQLSINTTNANNSTFTVIKGGF